MGSVLVSVDCRLQTIHLRNVSLYSRVRLINNPNVPKGEALHGFKKITVPLKLQNQLALKYLGKF